MREENEVIKQILEFAGREVRVRAVMMNGSRVNPNAPRDSMQDYDVVFFITHIENISYKTNREWINSFGEIVIVQQNNFEDGSYIFLMQFKDGIRIDLSFRDISDVQKGIKEDTLTRILLDKDGILPELPPADDSGYYVKKPEKHEFDSTMNNAWWIQTYVAKGILRDELPLAKYMFDVILINHDIYRLLSWSIAMKKDWKVNPGKCGKWFKHFLPEQTFKEFASLYPSVDYEDMWKRLFEAGRFIRKIGMEVAEGLGCDYPMEYDLNVTEFLKNMKAGNIYG